MGEFSYCCRSAQNTHEKWLSRPRRQPQHSHTPAHHSVVKPPAVVSPVSVTHSNQRYHDSEDASSSMVPAGMSANTTKGNSHASRESGLLCSCTSRSLGEVASSSSGQQAREQKRSAGRLLGDDDFDYYAVSRSVFV